MPNALYPNSASYKAFEDGASRFVAGVGGGAPASAVDTTAQTPLPTDLNPPKAFTGTLAPGTYNRAAIIALTTGTELMSMAITCATGTMDFSQGGGTISNLAAGSIIDRPYNEGFSVDDFLLTVDAASTAYIEALAV